MPRGKTAGTLPEACRKCTHWDQVDQRVRIRSVLTSMVEKLETRVVADDYKPTVGEFLKVLEAEKEMGWLSDRAMELKVRWEDPAAGLKN